MKTTSFRKTTVRAVPVRKDVPVDPLEVDVCDLGGRVAALEAEVFLLRRLVAELMAPAPLPADRHSAVQRGTPELDC